MGHLQHILNGQQGGWGKKITEKRIEISTFLEKKKKNQRNFHLSTLPLQKGEHLTKPTAQIR